MALPHDKQGFLVGELLRGFTQFGKELERIAPDVAAIRVDRANSAHVPPQPLRDVSEPLSRGFGVLFRGDAADERKRERWYRRFWRTLRGIEDKPVGDGSSGWLALMLPLLLGIAKGVIGLPLALLGGLGGLLGKLLPRLIPAAMRARLPSFGGGRERGGNGGNPPNPPDADSDRHGRNGRRGRGGRGGRFRGVKGLGILSGIAALIGIANVEADDSLSRAEKNREHGANAATLGNGLGGAALGAAIGTAILPGVGTVVGGLIGGFAADYFTGDAASELGAKVADWMDDAPLTALPGRIVDKVSEWTTALKESDIGQAVIGKVGEWTQTLLDSDIGKYLKAKWDALTGGIMGMWNNAVLAFSRAWDGVTGWLSDKIGKPVAALAEKAKDAVVNTANAANDAIKHYTGVDIKQSVGNAVAAVQDSASAAYDYARQAASDAVTAVGDKVGGVYQSVMQGIGGRKSSVNERWQVAKHDIVQAAKAAGVDAGVLANIAHFESSGFNPNARPIATNAAKNRVRQFDGTLAISSAHGYGQFLDGTWTDYLNKYGVKYGVAGAGSLTKEQANRYRTDTRLQAAMLAEFTRENVETGRNLGGKDDLANVYALHNLGGGDGAKFLRALRENPNQAVNQVLSAQVIAGNGSLYGDGRGTVAEAYAKMGAKMREGESYAQEARQMQNATAVATTVNPAIKPVSPIQQIAIAPSVSAVAKTAQIPAPPAISAVPKVPDAPVEFSPLNTATRNQSPVSITLPEALVGQDVRDRRIAHLATGGISG